MSLYYNKITDKNIEINNKVCEYDNNSIKIGFAIPKEFCGIMMEDKILGIKILDYNFDIQFRTCKKAYPNEDEINNIQEYTNIEDWIFYEWVIDNELTAKQGKLQVAIEIYNDVINVGKNEIELPTKEQLKLMQHDIEYQSWYIADDNINNIIYEEDSLSELPDKITKVVAVKNLLYILESNELEEFSQQNGIEELPPLKTWVDGSDLSTYTGSFPISITDLQSLTLYDSFNLNNIPSYLETIINSFYDFQRVQYYWSSMPFSLQIDNTIENSQSSKILNSILPDESTIYRLNDNDKVEIGKLVDVSAITNRKVLDLTATTRTKPIDLNTIADGTYDIKATVRSGFISNFIDGKYNRKQIIALQNGEIISKLNNTITTYSGYFDTINKDWSTGYNIIEYDLNDTLKPYFGEKYTAPPNVNKYVIELEPQKIFFPNNGGSFTNMINEYTFRASTEFITDSIDNMAYNWCNVFISTKDTIPTITDETGFLSWCGDDVEETEDGKKCLVLKANSNYYIEIKTIGVDINKNTIIMARVTKL